MAQMNQNRAHIMRIALAGIGLGIVALAATTLLAQPPARGGRDRNGREESGDSVEAALARLMKFDANGDGKLTKEELTDKRLQPLFERADANQDGIATREELSAALSRDAAGPRRPGGEDGPPDGAPGPRGGARGRGPEGRAPEGREGGRAFRPGVILPPHLQDDLKLSDEQRREIDALQKETDSRLAKILTAEQQQQLREIGVRGPGQFGPPPGGEPREGGPRDGGPRQGDSRGRRGPPNGRPQRPQP
jgi:hypothetical protein